MIVIAIILDGDGMPLVPAAIGCDVTSLVPNQLGPCAPAFGQSVF